VNYFEALEFIHGAPKFPKKPGNENLKNLLEKFDNPQSKLNFIHIAGTNGKGSCAAMLHSVLKTAGYKTGLFVSPFIEVFNERIVVNGEMIPDGKIAELTLKVKTLMDDTGIYLPEFSIIFVIALLYYIECGCEIVVLETGLGGRLDATNMIDKSLVSAIMSIGMDHMQYLGNTKAEIAAEKCGIIKENSDVVLYPVQDKEVFEVAEAFCKKQNARLCVPEIPESSADGEFEYKGRKYSLSLRGSYQPNNASVVLEIIRILQSKGFEISEENIKKGLENTLWPARFEWLSDKLLVDGCHNEDGANAFAASVKGRYDNITLVTAMMKDKSCETVVEILSGIADRVIVTEVNYERTIKAEELKEMYARFGIEAEIEKDSVRAVNKGLQKGGICAVCGSLYLAGEIRKVFR